MELVYVGTPSNADEDDRVAFRFHGSNIDIRTFEALVRLKSLPTCNLDAGGPLWVPRSALEHFDDDPDPAKASNSKPLRPPLLRIRQRSLHRPYSR